jgi:hypothetical protein
MATYDINTLLDEAPYEKNKKKIDINELLQASEPTEVDLTKPYVGYRKFRSQKATEQQQQFNPQDVIQPVKQFGQSLASLGDITFGGIIPAAVGTGNYAMARALGASPEFASKYKEFSTNLIDKPFGKAFGVTETPGYKGEASQQLMNFIGENVGKGADWIAQQTGVPKQDVEHYLGLAGIATTPYLPKVANVVGQGAKIAGQGLKAVGTELQDVKAQLGQQFQNKQAMPQQLSGMQSGGAAAAQPQNVLRSNIEASLTNASPELQAHVKSVAPEKINLPALETRALEEKHGINLSEGQRTNDIPKYSSEWNKRGETSILGEHFNEQPKQFKSAFENLITKHAPDIVETEPSAIGQLQINALGEKDVLRKQAISEAYKKLEDANGGQFPIDISQLKNNIDRELKAKLKFNAYEDKLGTIKKDIDSLIEKGHMTFADFENLRTNLADELRSNGNGTARQAAYIVRDQLENLPLPPELQAIKPLADQARALNKERMQVINSNPAYKAAVKEFSDLNEAGSTGESLNAEKFHQKFVTNATPESIRRLKVEIADNPQALQSLTAGELKHIMRKAGLSSDVPDLNTKTFTNFLLDNKAKLNESLGPQAAQDLMEIGLLANKVGMPKTGLFNTSNSFSALLGNMAKQGALNAGEMKLAGLTGGASVIPVSLGKQMMQKFNKENFASQAINPHSGIIKEQP